MQKLIARVLIALISFPFPVYVNAETLALPSDDINAPVVKHLASKKPASAQDGHIFTATVTDDVGVATVILYYRESGAMTYNRLAMTRVLNTDEFTAFIEPSALPEKGLEYYIQAKDLAGNSLLRGYSFSPLKLTVDATAPEPETPQPTPISEPTLVQTSQTNSDDEEDSIWSNKWLWIGLGVLAVGAAAAGGGGGGGGGGTDPTPTPETGTISGSIPQP